jgi:hypothetical protein
MKPTHLQYLNVPVFSVMVGLFLVLLLLIQLAA